MLLVFILGVQMNRNYVGHSMERRIEVKRMCASGGKRPPEWYEKCASDVQVRLCRDQNVPTIVLPNIRCTRSVDCIPACRGRGSKGNFIDFNCQSEVRAHLTRNIALPSRRLAPFSQLRRLSLLSVVGWLNIPLLSLRTVPFSAS